jgi:hypothetical protein
MFEIALAGFAIELPYGAGFGVKDADGVSFLQALLGLLIINGIPTFTRIASEPN